MRVVHRPLLLIALTALAPAQTPAPSSGSPSAVSPQESAELYELGRQLFEQLPPGIKEQYYFPTPEQWNAFATKLDRALETESLGELAALAPEARQALVLLRTLPGYEDYADWLLQRLDELEGAEQATAQPPATPPAPAPAPPTRPGAPPAPRPALVTQPVPHYDLWLKRVRGRPLPSRAAELMPRLQAAFVAEGVPAELAWLAEAESSLNPSARSPAGAKGLFQFMPETAQAMGLDTFLPDERTHPEKSARAAARYLRSLHDKFGNWALALAAYNAGEGRVRRTLAARKATTYTAIAEALPAETRMYVPKVCALIMTRTGIAPGNIPPPRK